MLRRMSIALLIWLPSVVWSWEGYDAASGETLELPDDVSLQVGVQLTYRITAPAAKPARSATVVEVMRRGSHVTVRLEDDGSAQRRTVDMERLD